MKFRKNIKRLLWIASVGFVLLNVVAFFHAYKFTHFSDEPVEKTEGPQKLSFGNKLKTLAFGVNNPRPENSSKPTTAYETIQLKEGIQTECWYIPAENPKGTVVICHGYSGHKSSMLDKAEEFLKMGYNTLIPDFMGSGGSEGNTTTIGYKEADQVKMCYDYLRENGEEHIFFFGTSMGAVAVMKAMDKYALAPQAIIIECPFGSMYKTTCARFKEMGAPTFPAAGLLLFWGGVQTGFWPFSHNPTEYAKSIKCPTLLLYGEEDSKVSQGEIDEIYQNLQGEKDLITYPNAGHENYLLQYKEEWIGDVEVFLSKIEID